MAAVGSKVAPLKPLDKKQDLLLALLATEQNRLTVWLYPLDTSKRGRRVTDVSSTSQQNATLANMYKQIMHVLLPMAWVENPAIAIHLPARFPSQDIFDSVRYLLLNHSELAISEPDALPILLGSSLPNDVSSQLKVRTSNNSRRYIANYC